MVREQAGVTKVAVIAVIAGLGLVAAVSIVMTTPDPAPSPDLSGFAFDFDQNTASKVLLAIRRLESDRDPKCHSTACRFENFIYGTPLTAEARDRKVELQKELILGVWTRATWAAAKAGARTLTRQGLAPFIDRVATITEDDDSTIVVRFPDAEPVEISPVRRRQFATIAFSLRAILAVGQDAALRGTPLAPLDDDATAELEELVNAVTLCALKLADQEARRTSAPEVGPELLVDAWLSLVPPAAVPPGPVRADGSVAEARRAGREVLFSMIDNKVAAYRAYNNVDTAEVVRRFANNIQTYYAKFRLPLPDGPRLPWLMQAYRARLLVFVRELVTASQRLASENGHEFIRASDALAVTERLLPRRIDDFEDLHYFHRLGPDDRVTLESYDCDSFRDTGLHWLTLKNLYLGNPDLDTLPDPFAAEILTEAASEYGVLLFRVAGRIATAQDDPMMVLTPRHIAAAGDAEAGQGRRKDRDGQDQLAAACRSRPPDRDLGDLQRRRDTQTAGIVRIVRILQLQVQIGPVESPLGVEALQQADPRGQEFEKSTAAAQYRGWRLGLEYAGDQALEDRNQLAGLYIGHIEAGIVGVGEHSLEGVGDCLAAGLVGEHELADRAVGFRQQHTHRDAVGQFEAASDLGAANSDGTRGRAHLHGVGTGLGDLAGDEHESAGHHRHERRAGIGCGVVDQLVEHHLGVAAERECGAVQKGDLHRAIRGGLQNIALIDRGADVELHRKAVGAGGGDRTLDRLDLPDVRRHIQCGGELGDLRQSRRAGQRLHQIARQIMALQGHQISRMSGREIVDHDNLAALGAGDDQIRAEVLEIRLEQAAATWKLRRHPHGLAVLRGRQIGGAEDRIVPADPAIRRQRGKICVRLRKVRFKACAWARYLPLPLHTQCRSPK